MNLIFFDGAERDHLLPLTFTRPVAHLRIGILRIFEKWEKHLETQASFLTQPYLSEKYSCKPEAENYLINGSVCPGPQLIEAIENLEKNTWLVQGEKKIAIKLGQEDVPDSLAALSSHAAASQTFEAELLDINHLWGIFSKNEQALNADFDLLTANRTSEDMPSGATVMGGQIFIEKGAEISPCIINATTGPVYIGKNAKILEGAMIRNGLALCDHAVLKMGAKVYGATTIGPHSKVGGEVSNVLIQGFSNKGHDGYLGNSVIGEWCNLGADTNCSNLKNDYGSVKMWNYASAKKTDTGQQFCGLMMGDHSKCSINTMFNTGTVVGVFANLFGSDFPPQFVPSFTWGNSKALLEYRLDKAFSVAEAVMGRRDKKLDETEKAILSHIFEITKSYRKR